MVRITIYNVTGRIAMRSTPVVVIIFFTMFFTCLQPYRLPAQDRITWMEAVAPPFFIHDGKLRGQGYQDLIQNIVIENLPQYEHSHMKANISRHYQQWKQGEKSCAIAMFKTPERQEFAYFSLPSVFTLPTVLIIHKENFKKLGGKKTVSLQHLLESGSFVLGRSDNRSYGLTVDTILNTFGSGDNIFSFEGGELSLNLFKMLMANRIDALTGLPEEAMYLAETFGIKDQIMTLNIKENEGRDSASISYVACSKNDWGKKAIEDINSVLITRRPTNSYRGAYERWLDPSSLEDYRRLYKDVFLVAK